LSLFRELRQIAKRHPEVPFETILRLGTLNGAEALGIDRELGSITPGKLARLTVVALSRTEGDPHELLITAGKHAQPLSL
jgi:aminodeoxyfutalosine deaminase